VADTALYLDAMSGPEKGDLDSPPPFERALVEAAGTRPGKLRIACSTKTATPVKKSPEVLAAYNETIELLRSLGHEVTEAAPPYSSARNDFFPMYFRGIRDEALTLPHPERLSDQTKGFVRMGRLFSDRKMGKVRDRMPAATAKIQAFFGDYDLLMTPATARLPFEVGKLLGKGALNTMNAMANVYPYGFRWNYTGQPAATIPAGFTDDGLPRSVMMIARPNREDVLVSLGAQLEAERPWADRRPSI
jgi:amidase